MIYNIVCYINTGSPEYVESTSPLVTTSDITKAKVIKVDLDRYTDKDLKNLIEIFKELKPSIKGSNTYLKCVCDSDLSKYFTIELTSKSSSIDDIASSLTSSELALINEFFRDVTDAYISLMISNDFEEIVTSAIAKAMPTMGGKAPVASDKDVDAILDYISKNTQAEVSKPTEKLDDYICEPLLKSELEEIKDFFENATDYKSKGIIIPKGILFKGPPGTGKTYAAKCIAGSVDCYFITCTASSLQGMYIGSGADNVRKIFQSAKQLSKASDKGVIIFIDELDSFGNRTQNGTGAGGEENRTLNQLLAEMSGFDDSEGVMVLAATNYPERLDNALLRSGRFGRQITISYPDAAERYNLIKYYFDKIKLPLIGTDYLEISNLIIGLSPADIKEVANEAGILTIRKKESSITLDTINSSIDKIITKNIKKPDGSIDEQSLVAAHESGHVLAEWIYTHTTSIKVTNYKYGDAGGFTQSDKHLEGLDTKDDYLNQVKILVAGRAAEKVICGYITNGASNDLQVAKNILHNYYEIYNFEYYDCEKIEQTILDTLNNIFKEVVEKFKEPEYFAVLRNLQDSLIKNRVLYKKDIFKIVSVI